jgi:hypothetical protein
LPVARFFYYFQLKSPLLTSFREGLVPRTRTWTWVGFASHFDREAASLEEAIFSAVAAGFVVSKLELNVDAAVSLGA